TPWTAIATGHYAGSVQISLCSDSECAVPQPVPSIRVPFDVSVLFGTWPGDNLTELSAWPGVADWGNYQGNSAHTGYVPVTLDPNQFSTRWNVPAALISGTQSANISGVTTADGMLYVAGGYALLARKESDGTLVWQHDFS